MSEPWYAGLKTERHRKFCELWSENGGNAFAAARDAGYKHPQREGARLLENARIRAALEALRQATTNAAIATREERQAFWTEVMKSTNEAMRDRLKASDLLGRSQADFIERVESTHRFVIERSYGRR